MASDKNVLTKKYHIPANCNASKKKRKEWCNKVKTTTNVK
jgi:hypothetical protein